MKFEGIKAKDLNKKITNLFGTCGTRIYYDTTDVYNPD